MSAGPPSSGAAAATIIRERLERKNIRKLVEELRTISTHQHDADIADAMLGVLEWVRVSSDESEENKAVRSALEALYSCWVEGSLTLPVLEKACFEYLLPPAKNPNSNNSAQRMCTLLLGCFLSGKLVSARFKLALISPSSSSSSSDGSSSGNTSYGNEGASSFSARPPLHTTVVGNASKSGE